MLFLIIGPEWRNWQTRWTQNPVVLSTVWVRPPPPGPFVFLFFPCESPRGREAFAAVLNWEGNAGLVVLCVLKFTEIRVISTDYAQIFRIRPQLSAKG